MVHPPSGSASSNHDVVMSNEATAEYLQRAGDGVLTMGGEGTVSFPVSFAYDADAGNIVFQLFTAPESTKRAILDRDSIPATLVTYDCPNPDDWTSVVVDGTLVQSDPETVDEAQFVEQATPIGMSVFDTSPRICPWSGTNSSRRAFLAGGVRSDDPTGTSESVTLATARVARPR
jgi:nitroimidazol reductase NimA-like FMN-containing flavoprotein (pyridoxamine 5'-phosphate oxidase superfamily)